MAINVEPIVIVEGRYDKIRLENILSATVFITDGFGIFKNNSLQKTLKVLAKQKGAIILTDSDRAGFKIRKYLHDILNGCAVYDLYIPDIFGKEKRKQVFSAERKLGVEGIDDLLLLKLFENFSRDSAVSDSPITTTDLYECGLYGSNGSSNLRRVFQEYLGLPARVNKNMLLKILGNMFTREQFFIEFQKFIQKNEPYGL